MRMEKLQIYQHTYWHQLKSFTLEQDTYPEWSVFCVEEGEFAFEVMNIKGVAGVGDLIFCPPGIPLQREAKTPLNFHFFRFQFFDSQWSEDIQPGSIKVKDTVRLHSTYTYLRKYAYEQSKQITAWKEHLLRDILQLIRMENERALFAMEEVHYNDSLIYDIVLFIRKHAFSHIQIKDIAKTFGLSSVQLTRRFVRSFHLTPIDYLTTIRVRKARELLLSTDDTLEVIAEQSGISNGFYLSRVFKQRMGMSPSEYRKTHWI